jgi:triosephosphate isomerase
MLIAGNWKMNTLAAEGVALAQEIAALAAAEQPADTSLLVCPPFTGLASVASALRGTLVSVGAQNCHHLASGAYTGEVSAVMLASVGASFVILGHSERRQYCGETDEMVNHKMHAALAANLVPIVCIGETLDERQGGTTESVLRSQLAGSLAGLAVSSPDDVVVAYEPVWAIGTGLAATAEQIRDTHAFIRTELEALLGSAGTAVKILYGGSLKSSNAREVFACANVDGGLIGGAALQAADFLAIARAASAAALAR